MRGTARLRNYLIAIPDIITIFVCFYIVLLFGRDDPLRSVIALRKILYVTVASVALIFYFTDMYRDIFKKYKEIVFNCILAGITGVAVFAFFVYIRVWPIGTVRVSYLFVTLLLIAFMSTERILFEFFLRFFMKTRYITIIGDMEQGLRTGYEFLKNQRKTHIIKYIFSTTASEEQLADTLTNTDIVIICPGIEKELKDRYVELTARFGKDVLIIPELYEINTMRPRLTQIDDTPYLYFDSRGLSGEEKFIKRSLDLFFSILLSIIVLPVVLVCALIIKIESRGPVFFTQERVSRDGSFEIVKLRTMVRDAERTTGAVLSGENDTRITKFGKFLRKSRLDELPQLWNVIKGDMSLIGPRPERPVFIKEFIEKYPDYDKRHSVKAGISGLAQIMGKYTTNAMDKLRYDLIYIRNYSLALDIKIFFLTLKTVFLEPGSVSGGSGVDYSAEMKKYDILIIE